MPEEQFRLPQSSYEEVAKIIRAYGHTDQPSVPAEIGSMAGIHQTIVSSNNAFLLSIGVIDGGKKKVMTSKGKALANALEHELADQIRLNWREVVLANEFLQKILSAVKIRKGMERSTLQSHIAYSASQPKNPRTMAGASAVVDILIIADLIREEGDKFVVPMVETTNETIWVLPKGESTKSVSDVSPTAGAKHWAPSPISPQGLAISLQIQVQCAPNDIESLGPKLKALIKEILEPPPAEEKSKE
jgi:hypothetical protein